MGKRGVIRQLLSWRKQSTGPSAPAPRHAARLETLESRQLLSAVVNITWHGQKIDVYKNEYIVQFTSTANIAKLAKESSFTNVQSLGGDGYYSLKSVKTMAQMDKWAANRPASVSLVTPNAVVHATDLATPNDPYFPVQWQYNNTGQIVPDPQFDPDGLIAWSTNPSHLPEAGTPGADISAAEAWTIVRRDSNFGDASKQIVVAVIDTGIDLTHPDLVNNIWTNTREIPGDGIDNDGNGYVDDVNGWNTLANSGNVLDDNGHGTHVSGIVGAQGDNGVGVTGVIQGVHIMPVKVLDRNGSGSWASIVRGFEYVARLKTMGTNIVVANASLGGTVFPFNRIFNDVITRLGQAGTLLTIAAGNDALNVDPGQDFPGKFSLNQPNVITVAATDDHDNIAFFSNIGATSVQIAAPGLNILSTLPTYDVGTLLTTGEIVPSGLTSYGYESGTSMASPMVAGAIALMKAAKPDASAMELKNALLTGTDYIAALDKPISAGSPLVSTSGRLNVNKAILTLLNQRTNVDTSTRGSWVGVYGKQGAVIYGETGSITEYSNSFVTARVSGASLNVVAETSNDPDALQQQFNHSNRIASQLTAAGPITLDLEFTDGKAHRVSLYQARFNNRPIPQNISVVDPDTGVVLATYTTGNLTTGEYQTFEINPPPGSDGTAVPFRVRLVVTPSKSSSNAVLNGIFFDPATTNDGALVTPAPVAGVTPETGGDWRSNFGSQGATVFGSGSTISGLRVSRGTQVVSPQFANSDAALIQTKATSDKQRVAGYVQTKSAMDLRLNVGSGSKKLTLYAADFGKLGRAQRLDLYDDATGALLSTVDMTNFAAGKYVSWIVTGKVRVHVTRLAGPTAVVSGVFLDAAPGAAVEYVGMDTTTSGNWRTLYGSDANFVFGSGSAPVRRNNYSAFLNSGADAPGFGTGVQSVTVKVTNGSNPTPYRVTTTDPRFPLMPNSDTSLQRVSNPKVTGNAMTVDLKFTDQQTHLVSLYMVDPDKNNVRAQRVELQLINPETGKAYTVASQIVSSFSKGKYVVFNAKQTSAAAQADVRIRITRITGPTAVVNAVFLG